MSGSLTLDSYRLLGRSGLRVSPICLGAMTFGSGGGWCADEVESRRMFDAYAALGGNFIDTANLYTGGMSERLVGKFAASCRDRFVIGTKYSLDARPGDPNASGNHRKSMVRSVEASLGRLSSGYIDLLYLHDWDSTTPSEEILRAMDDLVRAGKVLYLGISNTAAWQISRMQAMADLRGWSPLVALQAQYNLIERTAERDLIPMAKEMGLGVIPWSPLGGGILSGKYARADLAPDHSASGKTPRREMALESGKLSEKSLSVAQTVTAIATQIGRPPSQVALAWLLTNSGVTSPIVGARNLAQLEQNLGALQVALDAAQLRQLDDSSAIELGFPHDYLALPGVGELIFGSNVVQRRDR